PIIAKTTSVKLHHMDQLSPVTADLVRVFDNDHGLFTISFQNSVLSADMTNQLRQAIELFQQ
ncbi:MAG: hypothetical protein HRT35_29170, partial [Algicola sp.]|nr:hypothetical protein [Algicola sp.]